MRLFSFISLIFKFDFNINIIRNCSIHTFQSTLINNFSLVFIEVITGDFTKMVLLAALALRDR